MSLFQSAARVPTKCDSRMQSHAFVQCVCTKCPCQDRAGFCNQLPDCITRATSSLDTLPVIQDVREKALMKVARRGVVRLFNAVSKAQKQQLEESAVGQGAKVKRHALASRLLSSRSLHPLLIRQNSDPFTNLCND